MQFVVVNGPPGSGKSTLAARLAIELGWPLIAKDDIKEALGDALDVGGREWTQRLSAASFEVMWAVAARAPHAVLEGNFYPSSAARLRSLDAPFAGSGPCMHEAIFSDANLAEGFSTLDVAKGLIDEGFHPMTVYFPLVVHGAMLVEPTETESKAALDQFIGALRSVAERAKAGDVSLKSAPHFAPRSRLDETLAARKPVLVWKDPARAEAAE